MAIPSLIEMPDLNTLGYGGTAIVVGALLLRFVVWDWLKSRIKGEEQAVKRQEQAEALYDIERKAHMATRAMAAERIEELEQEVISERGLRKAAEMELRQVTIAHDQDRTLWRSEREELRDLTEKLRGEVRALNGQVGELKSMVDRRKNDLT